MRRALVTALLAGALGLAAAPTAAAQGLGVADTCTTPTTGTNTAPNQPCWVAGLYNGDYAGMADTSYYAQAGGHPFEGVTDFIVANSGGVPDANVSNIRVDIPPGLISDPQAVPPCSSPNPSTCLSSSQLGLVRLELYSPTTHTDQWFGASVYNMTPPAGKVSDYAFEIPLVNVRTDIIGGIRSGVEQFAGVPNLSADDGLYFTINVPSSVLPAELVQSTLIFWGVPGDSAHAPDAGWSCSPANILTNPTCAPPASNATHNLSGTPFLTLPSGCLPAGQVSTLTLSDSSDQAQATSKTPVAATGCTSARFDPSLTLTPQTTQSDSPTGVTVDVHVPQDPNPNDQATSTLQTATVTLPPGMTLNPSAANGLAACSPQQFGQGSDAAPSCPAASKLGTAEIDTPLLPSNHPLTGSVYLGCDGSSPQTPCTPATPGGPLTASLYVYVTDPAEGIDQKLVGSVTTDPSTGQVTTTFANQPQVPFTDFILDLNSGPTATLATPLSCGSATTTSSIVPYSGNAGAAPTSSFSVSGCPQPTPFAPGLAVADGTLQAGAFDNPLTLTFTRADGQQYLGGISVALPPGLLAVLGNVPQCTEPQASTGDCPAATQIGDVAVEAGAGSEPISQSGSAYLTTGYNGAPFGLSIVVPAIAGPFDLGTVVVRAGINVDRNDAHVTVVSDPLPQVVGGVPLRLRAVSIKIDRPAFVINPTSCASRSIGATLTSTQGASASLSSPFQANDCPALPFSPTLSVGLARNYQTTNGGHPTLTATVTSALGQANLSSASVTLPLSLALDPNNSQHVCSVAASQTDSCPASTAIGSATVTTPLLSQPLTGTVYLVQGIRTGPQGQQIRTLPALLIPLRGQVAIDLRGQTSVDSRSRLVSTFPTLPDAAVSRFTITINGGSHGILVVTGGANLCHRRQVAGAAFTGQSGANLSAEETISVPCAKRASVKRIRAERNSVRVQVAMPQAGWLRASASGLSSARRKTRRASRVWLTLRLTPSAAVRLRRTGRLELRIRLAYTPRGWPTQTIYTRRITIRG